MPEEKNNKFCSNCGAEIDIKAKICPKCGVEQPIIPEKVSNWWYIFAIFLGIIGGVIAWAVNKDHDHKKAVHFLIIGFIQPIIFIIIGILSSVVLVSLGGAREKARDAQRHSDFRQISLAMEMYYDDNQAYATATNMDGLVTKGIRYYLPAVPEDPLDSDNYVYFFVNNTSDDQRYCAYAELEEGGFFTASRNGTVTASTKPAVNDLDCGW